MNQVKLENPRLGVLLAAYNGSKWLSQQILSILDQRVVNVTLFISVDVSDDGTEALVDEIAKNDSRVIVLPHGSKFGGAARNFFRLLHEVDLRTFDYIAFSDQDDIWLPEKLQRACSVLVKSKSDAYSSSVLAFWPSGKKKFVCKSQNQKKFDFLFEAAGPGCTYVLSRKLAEHIQSRLNFCWEKVQDIGLHDWFIYAFARANGYRWEIDSYSGILYRQHENNQVGINSGMRAFKKRAQKVLSGWALNQAALIADIAGIGNEPFVRSWRDNRRVGLIWLFLHFYDCRRRWRDKLFFAGSCIVLFFCGLRTDR